jgi:hypothetical protein
LGEHTGSPLRENIKIETIKMVKARGYELLPVTQLKLGVILRGFGLTKKSATKRVKGYIQLNLIFPANANNFVK